VAEQSGYIPNAIVAVPVASPARLLGVLSLLDRDTTREAASEDMRLLSLFADQAAIALESVRVFSDVGRILLAAVEHAAAADSDLGASARAAAAGLPATDRDLARLAATFAELSRRGPAEHELALGVLEQFATYSERRSPRNRIR
jgi:GAF domain-containing protein